MPERKTIPVEVLETKAATDANGRPQGVVKALFSVYDVVDSDDDITRPGAFDPLIAKVGDGQRIPYVFSHNSWSLDGYIGTVTAVEESARGPVATAELFLDDPQGAKAFRLLESGAITQHSYQYDVKASHVEDIDGKSVRVLDELDVHELGPCLLGANSDTVVLDAKGLKAGRVLSTKNEQKLRDAVAAITDVLDQVASEDAGKTAGTPEPKAAEDHDEGKADESAEDPDGGKAAPPEDDDVDLTVLDLELAELETHL